MKLVFAPTTGSFLDSGDPFREEYFTRLASAGMPEV